ncbi:hypothetical protein Dimus_001411 [Dionaea muscipula]
MNFFDSIFSDDPQSADHPNSPPHPETPTPPNPNPSPAPPSPWNFGSLIKTIANRSESVIDNYRRDIGEFRSGLLKETALIRDVATRAVKEFPDSIDAGATVAQESLESVGQAIDNLGSSVWKGTEKIIARTKELHLFDDDNDDYDDGDGNSSGNDRSGLTERGLSISKFSRFEMRLRDIQGDSKTYVEEPEDLEEYRVWKSGFVLEEKREDIENLMAENLTVERMYMELVPGTGAVDQDTFWSRYFYRIYRLNQAEEARERIVKRAISGEDEEELSWDVDEEDGDGDGDGDGEVEGKSHVQKVEVLNRSDGGEGSLGERNSERETDDQEVAEASSSVENVVEMEVKWASDVSEASGDVDLVKADEGVVTEAKNENGESCKDSDISIVSSQPSLAGGEELGWDEIEEVGSEDDGSKGAVGKSSNVSDLRKRLSAAEEEEDLSWDIEDDDEPVKS